MFAAAASQWRVGFDGPTGLDYGAVEVLRRAYRVPNTWAWWERIRTLEAEALAAMRERKADG